MSVFEIPVITDTCSDPVELLGPLHPPPHPVFPLGGGVPHPVFPPHEELFFTIVETSEVKRVK